MASKVAERLLSRTSLERLRHAALDDFPERRHREQIENYINELSHLLALEPEADFDVTAAQRAKATCDATGDDEVTLLYKLEDYLESILVERMVTGARR